MLFSGEIAALTTAFCWALATVYFRQLGHAFSPLTLNLWKGILSIVCLSFVLIGFSPSLPELKYVYWLLISGVIGIGIGDTAFFAALNRLGERNTLLVAETLAPIFTALLAIIWINEWLTPIQWLAIAVVLLGVDIVLRCKKSRSPSQPISLTGLSLAAIAALCQASGAVIGRFVLTRSDIDPATASLIRLIGGIAVVIFVLLVTRKSWLPKKPADANVWRLLVLATFIGTFLALILQMYAFSQTQAAIVQSLFATCIIFSLLIAKLQGQPVTPKAVIGSFIAIAGVSLIFIY
ncbi:DMT family transporter [Aliikangiella marina]|uniref:DMT family transporter n=1 Tax=Aliikangiella marina TaxID=1712262 RepID=A0A545T9Z8_9GAMM|nr:DMT family transporter [Aliikangiella marina]TQV74042.1 DMT family transporter [Aliikangiella marina]